MISKILKFAFQAVSCSEIVHFLETFHFSNEGEGYRQDILEKEKVILLKW